jgi:hypothetical protein
VGAAQGIGTAMPTQDEMVRSKSRSTIPPRLRDMNESDLQFHRSSSRAKEHQQRGAEIAIGAGGAGGFGGGGGGGGAMHRPSRTAFPPIQEVDVSYVTSHHGGVSPHNELIASVRDVTNQRSS